MSNKLKVFVSHAKDTCYKWIDNAELIQDIDKAELVIFTGGVDVNPQLYNQKGHTSTQTPQHDRDYTDLTNFCIAASKGIPMLGICRGAQFIHVMNSGALVQNIYNHSTDHKIMTNDGEELYVTSSHHQMINLNSINSKNYELIGYSLDKSTSYSDDSGVIHRENLLKIDNKVVEPEIVYYNNFRALALQYHPEYVSCKKETVEYTNELIKKYLIKELVV